MVVSYLFESIYTKLGNFVKLALHSMTMWINSCKSLNLQTRTKAFAVWNQATSTLLSRTSYTGYLEEDRTPSLLAFSENLLNLLVVKPMWAWYCVFSNWSQAQHFAYNKRPWRLAMRLLAWKYSYICQHNTCEGYWETDTRVFLLAAHAVAAGYRAIVIRSDDTDVFVVSLTFKGIIPCLSNAVNRETRTTYIDVSRIVRMLGSELCKSFPGFHEFTGCDSVSAQFSGKGRLTNLKLVKQIKSSQTLFQERDVERNLKDERFANLKSSHTRCTALL